MHSARPLTSLQPTQAHPAHGPPLLSQPVVVARATKASNDSQGKWEQFFKQYWEVLQDGGLLLVHSTVTNQLTRGWLDSVRSREKVGAAEAELGGFSTMSFLEPHKLFQNSFSAFRKRGPGFAEPVYTKYP